MAEHELFEPIGDYIDGAFALPEHADGEIRAEEPGDLDRDCGAFPFAHASVDAAVASARQAFPAWRDASPEERATCLGRFKDAIEADKDRLAEAIAREVGKPLWEARTEVAAMIGKVDITLGAGLDEVKERAFDLAPGQVGRWTWQARGALCVLGPFNFPGHLVHGHVIPALATGNTVVVKPSEHTPAVGQIYAELAARAGLPAGVFNHVQGDGAVGAALAAHRDLDGVLFTGSWSVGRAILEATLDQPWKIVALEMGGKNGVIVCEDADLDAAAHAIAFGTAVTAGQRCSATSRVLVERGVADALVEKLVRVLGGIEIGDPMSDGVFMGPVISAAARDRHASVLRAAAEENAEVLVAGGPVDGPKRGHYVRPSLHRVPAFVRGRYQTDEHFVPDACVLAIDDLDEGITALEATDYGLVASVFSARREVFERVRRETRLGLVNWNTSTVGASSKLPFGGAKQSGNDRAAAALSTTYTTYPVASLEFETPAAPADLPGLPKPD